MSISHMAIFAYMATQQLYPIGQPKFLLFENCRIHRNKTFSNGI